VIDTSPRANDTRHPSWKTMVGHRGGGGDGENGEIGEGKRWEMRLSCNG